MISIHALREEGDRSSAPCLTVLADFYPRPPRGGRQLSSALLVTSALFLSTPSARRATRREVDVAGILVISIHALREEGDTSRFTSPRRIAYFYPRPPRGGRLYPLRCPCRSVKISIHALREEGDFVADLKGANGVISIHALREEGDVKSVL